MPGRIEQVRTAVVRSVRLRTSVNAYAIRTLEELGHPPLQEDGASDGARRTSVIGLDPVRVLLFGGGLAVGYGAHDRAEALDEALARRVAEVTGRGCTLENRARRHVSLPETVASLGAVGTHTYHVAVWCPPFTEATRRLSLRSWATELHEMIRQLRQDEHTPLLMLEMPHPAGGRPVARIARPWILRINRVLRVVAREYTQVVVVSTGAIEATDPDRVVISGVYYGLVADQAAEAILELLGGHRLAAATTPSDSAH